MTSIPHSVPDDLSCDLTLTDLASRFRVFRALYGSAEQAAQNAFRTGLQELLDRYVTALLGRAPYQRAPTWDRTTIAWRCNHCGSQCRGHFVRNGHYERGIATSWGYVARIKVPMLRCKHCGAGYVALTFPFLAKYVRLWDDLLQLTLLDTTLGLSLRRQSERWAELGLPPLSLRALNQRVQVTVHALPVLETAPLREVPPVVQFDGIYFTLLERTRQVKRDAQHRLRKRLRARKAVALVALGLWPDGRHQVLGWALAPDEGTPAWQAFLLTLHDRGLTPARGLRLAIGDGAGGLREALAFVYYGQLPLQRCHFHKIQRIVHHKYLRDRSHRGELLQDASQVLQGSTRTEVYARLKIFRAKWQEREPASVRCFYRDFARCLTYLQLLDFPAGQFARTTSHAERLMRELRRKLRQVGTLITANGARATLTLLFRRINAQWRQESWLESTLQALLEAA
jgi:hypothetical protein